MEKQRWAMKSKRMRIAMIGQKRIPSREGGVEIVVNELSTRLAAKGYEVVTTFLSDAAPIVAETARCRKQRILTSASQCSSRAFSGVFPQRRARPWGRALFGSVCLMAGPDQGSEAAAADDVPDGDGEQVGEKASQAQGGQVNPGLRRQTSKEQIP